MRTAIITGCSSGIGKATAAKLVEHGWTVYATARRPETLAELESGGCRTLALDVTDEDSMLAAVDAVVGESGRIDALVNNAGYSLSGAAETLDLADVRRQFETNVFGLLRLSQLVLPTMREQRSGRIVNLSSMGGKVVFPGAGAYHASKFAVEAFSDAMRFEVAGFGVKVVVVEPGLITTNFDQVAVASIDLDGQGIYADFNRKVAAMTTDIYTSSMQRLGGPPEIVAKVIEKALTARRPRPRYTVTASAKIPLATRRLMSDRLWDTTMRAQFPRPRP